MATIKKGSMQWEEARRTHRLSENDVRMAKELGLPRSGFRRKPNRLRNVPPKQLLRHLYKNALFMKYMRQAERAARHPKNHTLLAKSELR
jgi:hypothetical protein